MSGRKGRYDGPALVDAAERACLTDGIEPTSRNLAIRLGVHRRTIFRWKAGATAAHHRVADRAEAISGRHVSTFERQTPPREPNADPSPR